VFRLDLNGELPEGVTLHPIQPESASVPQEEPAEEPEHPLAENPEEPVAGLPCLSGVVAIPVGLIGFSSYLRKRRKK
jgi:hypothetical protein